jgi:methylenetetrahydrofolate dehydrogenase (NADP+)/methenyltetrahydrofolate cyclohydrolase
MDGKWMDGKAYAAELNEQLADKVARLAARQGIVPKLCVIRVGADAAAVSYARAIEKNVLKYGMQIVFKVLAADSPWEAITACVEESNLDPAIDAVIIQEPLPARFDKEAIYQLLAPAKDVEGIHPYNVGLLAKSRASFDLLADNALLVPPTPAGGVLLLKKYIPRLDGQLAVIVGRSNILGKPLGYLLLQENATVMCCHSRSRQLPELCRQADILCAAIGKAQMITPEYVKTGAVVLDFGINFDGSKLVGDVDAEAVSEKVKWITPVPGGTGPMTNTVLMYNLYRLALRRVVNRG